MVQTAAGDYRKFSVLILKDLIKLIDLNHFVNFLSICELLSRKLPKWKYISFNNVCNVRVRAKLSIKHVKKIDTFQHNEEVANGLLQKLR